MDNLTRICISTSLWKQAVLFPQSEIIGKDEVENRSHQKMIFDLQKNENLMRHLARPLPKHSETERVKDSIGSPSERRKGSPQEEFIAVDPNFSEEMSVEEKDELLRRSKEENKKGN